MVVEEYILVQLMLILRQGRGMMVAKARQISMVQVAEVVRVAWEE
jgi:hypothetical protein